MLKQQGYLRTNQRLIGIIQILLDSIIIALAFITAYALYQGTPVNMPKHYWAAMIVGASTFYIVALNTKLYQSWRSNQLYNHFSQLFRAWIITVLILMFLAWSLKLMSNYSRVIFTMWIVLTPLLLGFSRYVLRKVLGFFRSQGRNIKYIAVVGNTLSAQALITEVVDNEWMGYRIHGQYADGFENNQREESYTGDYSRLIEDVRRHRYDEVFIALPMAEEKLISELVMQLSECSTPVHIIPDLFTFNLLNARMSRIGNIPAISIFDSPLDDVSGFVKRVEDLLLSSIILLFISPILLLIAMIIKLSSKGPVLFKQRRYGIGGEEIIVWKFRSMTVCEDDEHLVQASKNDSRITPLGAFLRRTSLDELPQFINVLQGGMSIVGPRPHAVAHNEQYRKSIHGYMLRHLVKPGITGWAQVNGWRGETDTLDKMEKRIEYDLQYIQNWSVFFDLKIIVLTIFKGFINKNAY